MGSIVSEDETSTLIIFNLDNKSDVNAIAKNVIRKTTALNLPEKLYYIGSPMLLTYISDLMRDDLTNLLPLSFLIIAFILFLSFRSISGVLLPLLIAIISIVMEFLNLKYDSRISEDAHDKISTRNYHAIVQQLGAIFGRNAIKMDITTLPVSRTNPETHTTQEKLNYYCFHQFFDPKNITLTCLTLYALVRIFSGPTGLSGCRIHCYIDRTRGLSLEESKNIILNRMNMSELTDNLIAVTYKFFEQDILT